MKSVPKSKERVVKAWAIGVPWGDLCRKNKTIPQMFYACKSAAEHIKEVMLRNEEIIECEIRYRLGGKGKGGKK